METKFTYLQKVRVIKGFYRGHEGIVEDYYKSTSKDSNLIIHSIYYRVRFSDNSITGQEEHSLEAVV